MLSYYQPDPQVRERRDFHHLRGEVSMDILGLWDVDLPNETVSLSVPQMVSNRFTIFGSDFASQTN